MPRARVSENAALGFWVCNHVCNKFKLVLTRIELMTSASDRGSTVGLIFGHWKGIPPHPETDWTLSVWVTGVCLFGRADVLSRVYLVTSGIDPSDPSNVQQSAEILTSFGLHLQLPTCFYLKHFNLISTKEGFRKQTHLDKVQHVHKGETRKTERDFWGGFLNIGLTHTI